jgi:hypothetical protein
MGRDAGALLAKARTDDPIDVTVVLVARSGDRILARDPDHLGRLASSSGKKLAIVPCRAALVGDLSLLSSSIN